MIKLITSQQNIFYYTGFTGSIGVLIIDGKKKTLFVDGRYTQQAEQEVRSGVKVVTLPLTSSFNQATIEHLKKIKAKEIGFEEDKVSAEKFLALKKYLPKAKFISIADEIRTQRMVKSPTEISAMKRAVEVGDAVFDCILRIVSPGITEKDIAAEMDYMIRILGGDIFAFETLVSSGKNAALVHGKPTEKVVRKGDLILMDFGVRYKSYNSDMTRMIAVGVPSPKQKKIYDTLLKAQLAAVAKVKAGIPASLVDKAARDVLKKAKLEKYFTHATGHGVGLAVHEGPRVALNSKDILKEGMVITVEPGVYIKGFGGFRIEDMVVVTKNGCEILTKTPKKLAII